MRRLILGLFLALSCTLQAQQPEAKKPRPNLLIFASPGGEFRVKINGMLQEPGSQFVVGIGEHRIEIWAPHHYKFDTVVTVKSGPRPTRVYKVLKPKPEYVKYTNEVVKESRLSGKILFGGVSTALIAGVAIFNYSQIGDLNLDYVRAENGVKYNIRGFSQSNLDDAERKLNNARTLQYVLYAGMAGMGTYTVIHWLKRRKMLPPKLKEDKSFLVDNVGMLYHPTTGYQWQLSVRF